MSGEPAQATDLRRAFPAVIAALVCVHASMAATRVAASLVLLQQGYGEWTVGLLLSLFAVAPIALSLWAGHQADRHGLHRTLAIGVAMGSAGACVAVATHHPVALGIAALASGGAIAVAAVGIQREAGRMARGSHDLKRVFSWVALGPALSNAVAPVTVGLLIDHAGYRVAFAFAAVLPLAAWALAQRVPRQTPTPDAATGPAAPPRRAFELLRLPAFRLLLLCNLAMAACWDAHSFVVPVLGHARGLSASSIGIVLGAFAVAATVVRLVILRYADRLDEGRSLRAAMVLAALTSAVYGWLPAPLGMVAGSAVLGLALGSVQPIVLASLHQVTPPDRHGQALGLRMLVTNGATVGMPLGFGLLAGVAGAAAPLWLMAAVVALALRPAQRIGRTAAP